MYVVYRFAVKFLSLARIYVARVTPISRVRRSVLTGREGRPLMNHVSGPRVQFYEAFSDLPPRPNAARDLCLSEHSYRETFCRAKLPRGRKRGNIYEMLARKEKSSGTVTAPVSLQITSLTVRLHDTRKFSPTKNRCGNNKMRARDCM